MSGEASVSSENHAYEEVRGCNIKLTKLVRREFRKKKTLTSATTPGDLKRLTFDHIGPGLRVR